MLCDVFERESTFISLLIFENSIHFSLMDFKNPKKSMSSERFGHKKDSLPHLTKTETLSLFQKKRAIYFQQEMRISLKIERFHSIECLLRKRLN